MHDILAILPPIIADICPSGVCTVSGGRHFGFALWSHDVKNNVIYFGDSSICELYLVEILITALLIYNIVFSPYQNYYNFKYYTLDRN